MLAWLLIAACCTADSAPVPPALTEALITQMAPVYTIADSAIQANGDKIPNVGRTGVTIQKFADKLAETPAFVAVTKKAGITPLAYSQAFLALRDAWIREIYENDADEGSMSWIVGRYPYASKENVKFVKTHGELLKKLGYQPPMLWYDD